MNISQRTFSFVLAAAVASFGLAACDRGDPGATGASGSGASKSAGSTGTGTGTTMGSGSAGKSRTDDPTGGATRAPEAGAAATPGNTTSSPSVPGPTGSGTTGSGTTGSGASR